MYVSSSERFSVDGNCFLQPCCSKPVQDCKQVLLDGSILFYSRHAAVGIGLAVKESVRRILVVPVLARPREPSIDHLVKMVG